LYAGARLAMRCGSSSGRRSGFDRADRAPRGDEARLSPDGGLALPLLFVSLALLVLMHLARARPLGGRSRAAGCGSRRDVPAQRAGEDRPGVLARAVAREESRSASAPSRWASCRTWSCWRCLGSCSCSSRTSAPPSSSRGHLALLSSPARAQVLLPWPWPRRRSPPSSSGSRPYRIQRVAHLPGSWKDPRAHGYQTVESLWDSAREALLESARREPPEAVSSFQQRTPTSSSASSARSSDSPVWRGCWPCLR